MKAQLFILSALAFASGCGHAMGPPSTCAADLLDNGYVKSSNRGRAKSIAEGYCQAQTPSTISEAKSMMDQKYESNFGSAIDLVTKYNQPQLACAKKQFETEKPNGFYVSATCQEAILAPSQASAGEDSNSLYAALKADGHFTRYLAAVDKAGLSDTLKSAGPWTAFAPTDEAVAKHQTEYDNLMARDFQLKPLITASLVVGVHPSSEIKPSKETRKGFQDPQNSWPNAAGSALTLTSRNGVIKVNSRATVLKADIPGGNGLIYSLDDFTY